MNIKKILLAGFFLNFGWAMCPPSAPDAQDIFAYEAERILFLKSVSEKDFSEELFLQALIYLGVKAPEIVYAQAVLETGNFTSVMMWRNNNLLGMRLARRRPTTAIGQIDHHALYTHWFCSVVDYKLFQDYHLSRGRDMTDYYTFLNDIGYATDSHYIAKLERIKDRS